VAVYDLGGGTFDISILEIGEGVVEVKATNGDTHLGGDELRPEGDGLDLRRVQEGAGIDLRKDRMALQRLKEAAEKGQVRAVHGGPDRGQPSVHPRRMRADPKHLVLHPDPRQARVPRGGSDRAEPRAVPGSDAGRQACRREIWMRSFWWAADPHAQGGKEEVKKLFGKDPNKTVNPDEVVAVGAAVQAAVLTGEVKDLLLLDVTPLSLGIETWGES